MKLSKQISKIRTYKNCSDLPILNLMIMVATGDLSMLIKNKDDQDPDVLEYYIERNNFQLHEKLDSIREEYNKLTFSKKELNRQKEIIEIMYLNQLVEIIDKVLLLYTISGNVEVLDILKQVDIKLKSGLPIEAQIYNVEKQMKVYKNKANIKKVNFSKKYNVDFDKERPDKKPPKEEIEKMLDGTALVIEKGLETGYQIDIRKTSVIRWVNLNELYEQRLAQLN